MPEASCCFAQPRGTAGERVNVSSALPRGDAQRATFLHSVPWRFSWCMPLPALAAGSRRATGAASKALALPNAIPLAR